MEVEIYVIPCGQGDTIILHLLNKSWVLIDCNLPQGTVRDAFFKKVELLGIQRFDVICLTHPHGDHFTGMRQVLEHFTSSGRSVGHFCDIGPTPRQVRDIRDILKGTSSFSEYKNLYHFIVQAVEAGRMGYFPAAENTEPLPVLKRSGVLQLLPLGPRPESQLVNFHKTLESGAVHGDPNRLSLVLALIVRTPKREFDALLAADVGSDEFKNALKCIERRLETPTSFKFDVIKVAHHGSLASHRGSGAAECCKGDRECIAAISAGFSRVLPDREVLSDYLNKKWIVLLTTKRVARRRTYVIELSNRGSGYESESHEIRINWSDGSGVSWSPEEARISLVDLPNYQSALD
jgi:ribonuclease BN (tRNA processing enzyme)